MKAKEYRYHIPIYYIFWELQCAEIPECIAVSKLPGLDPDPLWRHPSYGQVSSPSDPELRKLPSAFYQTFSHESMVKY
jgi:hypothetical protein